MGTRLSLRARLTALIAIAVALAVAGVSVGAWFAVRDDLRRQLDSTLTRPVVRLPRPTANSDLTQRTLQPVALRLFALEISPQGTPLAGDRQLPVRAVDIAVARGEQGTLRYDDRLTDGTHVRVVVAPAADGAIIRALPLTNTDHTLSRLALFLALVSGIGVVGAGGLGLLVARAGLRPVDRLTDAVEEIARTSRLEPVDIRGVDEIARLGAAFNTMTGALEVSRKQQRQLVLDAGHELRTPLTSLRTNVDLLVRSERSKRRLPPGDRARLLEDLTAQTDELATLVGELVELTRGGEDGADPESFDLSDVVAHAIERARLRAPQTEFVVSMVSVPMLGSPASLERAVLNLLDNAVKFGPREQTVTVTLTGNGTLQIIDEGPGISAEDLPHVFDRFYRATASRGLPGSGLGLAIVADAVRRHDGTVGVQNRPTHNGGASGVIATLTLPVDTS